MRIRMLSREDVRQAVAMAEAIDIVEGAFVQLSAGQAIVPVRTPVAIERHAGIVLYMPAYLPETDALGAKIVSIFPDNVQRGRATINALVVVNDAETGEPCAVLEGGYLTALRTGAVSGVATRALARPDARVAAIFGAGVQGRTQLEAVCAVRDIARAWVYDRQPEAAERYAAEMRARGGRIPSDIRVAGSPAEAAGDADVICTATTARDPVVPDGALRAGVHINAMGAFTPDTREIEEATVLRARVVLDSREAAWAEAGELIMPRDAGLVRESDVQDEIGEVAAGRKPGRSDARQITLFKAVGVAVQDVAVARRVLEAAETQGLGTAFEL